MKISTCILYPVLFFWGGQLADAGKKGKGISKGTIGKVAGGALAGAAGYAIGKKILKGVGGRYDDDDYYRRERYGQRSRRGSSRCYKPRPSLVEVTALDGGAFYCPLYGQDRSMSSCCTDSDGYGYCCPWHKRGSNMGLLIGGLAVLAIIVGVGCLIYIKCCRGRGGVSGFLGKITGGGGGGGGGSGANYQVPMQQYQPPPPQQPYPAPGSFQPPPPQQPYPAPGTAQPPPYSAYPTGQPAYPTSQPAYPTGQPAYPTGQPGYPVGQPAPYPVGKPPA